MTSKFDLTKSIFVIITGASQGIGRTIAIEISRRLKKSSKILLIARSENGLLETKKLIEGISHVTEVIIFPSDLSKLDAKDYDDLLKKQLHGCSFESALIIHNAGQVGELVKTTELNDMSLWKKYYDLNLFSVAVLNSEFLKAVKDLIKNIYVVNITSLCGRAPFKNMSMYGSAKAARELFFKVLAEEEKAVIVLNYSPGPVKTAMINEIVTNAKDEELKEMFSKLNALTCEQTVGRFMDIIENGNFKSGDTIDYFDID